MNGQAVSEDIFAGLDLDLQDEKAIDIYCWRMEQLLRAGYTHTLADTLAADNRVDLHAACDLIARGCPQDTAFRIVS
jgi:hypothetical protein